MKILEFNGKGQQVESDSRSIFETGMGSSLAPKPSLFDKEINHSPVKSNMRLYMFSTGILRTKTKYIKANQDEEEFDIPSPWFLIKHPKGNVVIDGGNALETAIDKRAHWGDVVDAYDPLMVVRENCVDQCKSAGVEPEDVRYVLFTHLHLDHSGAAGRFPNAQHIIQRLEHDYAFNPDWFQAPAYIRADFDRPGIDWKFLGGDYTDNYDVFGDGAIRLIFTPGHTPGHQSVLVNLPNTGPVLLTSDAVYTLDHWEHKALPGLNYSNVDVVASVNKLRKIVEDTGATLVMGHDTPNWETFRKGPDGFYD